jgi:hypothetical protein
VRRNIVPEILNLFNNLDVRQAAAHGCDKIVLRALGKQQL